MEKGKYKTLHQKWLDQKKWESHTDKQIAQAILIDALNFALTEDHPNIITDLSILEDQDGKSKM